MPDDDILLGKVRSAFISKRFSNYVHNSAKFDENTNNFQANAKILSTISIMLAYQIITKQEDDLENLLMYSVHIMILFHQ